MLLLHLSPKANLLHIFVLQDVEASPLSRLDLCHRHHHPRSAYSSSYGERMAASCTWGTQPSPPCSDQSSLKVSVCRV
jgi:hypothetical protein